MAQRPIASTVIVTLLLEFLAVGIFALIAGTDDRVATIVLLFMFGIFLMYIMTNEKTVAGLSNAIVELTKNPSNI